MRQLKYQMKLLPEHSSIHKMRITGLRFLLFMDLMEDLMALFKFVKNIGSIPIDVYNGNLKRDFTYIDDVINILFKISNSKLKNKYLFNIYNIAASNPKKLTYFIKVIEKVIGKKARINFKPMQKEMFLELMEIIIN